MQRRSCCPRPRAGLRLLAGPSSSGGASWSPGSKERGSLTEQLRVSGSCYEDVVDTLARRALQAASTKPTGCKLVIGIAGVPGSGKSTLASLASRRINELAGGAEQAQCSGPGLTATGGASKAVQLPMDGFHLYRRQLDAMPDPKEAHARRGAPWTFDGEAFVRCVRQVREDGEARCPSFDHGRGDPVEDDIHIRPEHEIVLVEGNYLLLEAPPWIELRDLFDDTWFLDVDLEVAMSRVFQRQTELGLAPETSRTRIRSNDRPNAELVVASKPFARVLVPSDIPLKSQFG